MRIVGILTAAGAGILASGCTTHLESGAPRAGSIPHGVSYHLPHLLHDVEVTRIVTSCPKKASDSIEFEFAGKVENRIVAGEPVVINYADLADIMKTTDFSVELYPSGVLKSINAIIDDRTADVATEAFKAALSVGKIALGLPQGGGTSTTPSEINNFLACTMATEKTVASLPDLQATIRTSEGELKKAAKALTDFNADHTEPERVPAVIKEATRLATAKRKAQEVLEAANKALADARASLTLISRFTVSPEAEGTTRADRLSDAQSGKVSPGDVLELRTKIGEKWLAVPTGPKLGLESAAVQRAHWVGEEPTQDSVAALATILGARQQDFENALAVIERGDVLFASAPTTLGASTGPALAEARACGTSEKLRCGVIYRTKVTARTRLCRFTRSQGAPTSNNCVRLPAGTEALLFSEDRTVPQMGQLVSLGLRNGPFANNSLSAEFGEDGSLLKFGYKKPRAEAVAIGQTVNAGLDTTTQLITYANGRELRDLAYEKQLNDARAAVLTSAKPLETPQPSAVTEVNNQTALIEAERKKVEAQIDLLRKQRELEGLTAAESAEGGEPDD